MQHPTRRAAPTEEPTSILESPSHYRTDVQQWAPKAAILARTVEALAELASAKDVPATSNRVFHRANSASQLQCKQGLVRDLAAKTDVSLRDWDNRVDDDSSLGRIDEWTRVCHQLGKLGAGKLEWKSATGKDELTLRAT